MTGRRWRVALGRALVGASLILAPVSGPELALAGKLEDFEKDATKENRDREKKDTKEDRSGGSPGGTLADSFFDVIVEGVVKGVFAAMLYGGSHSMKRVDPLDARPSENITPRREGEALLPFIRLDFSLQNVESDVTAWDWRGEAGYGPFAVQFRTTRYEEKIPPDELKTFQDHILYRMSFGPTVEFDAGVGNLFITGKEEHSGISFTFPLLIHPSRHYGIELRPTWSTIDENNIQDIDLSVLAGWDYASVRAGYRWFHSDRESLDGPFIGIALRW